MNKLTALLLSFVFISVLGFSQTKKYEINAGSPSYKQISLLPFTGVDPVTGEKFSVNNVYFEKNDKPWFPVMGEMHYNRVRPEDWDIEMKKMKAGGLSIVATYVFWNEHETAKGVWDWQGNRNLRQFIEAAKKNGLYVWLRIGPWSHGEQLHGGHPEWIDKMKGKRTNNPQYIDASQKLFEQIGKQTSGLFVKDGGPIIGVQLENEYASGQAEHITKLKELAIAAGIQPVYWTVTANTVFDDKKMEVIPLQGSYPYRGWERAGGKATKDFLYGNDQWIMGDAFGGRLYYDVDLFPKGLCEQGAGSQMTYDNRFIVEPHVVEAHLQNQIGRGMNLVGYYMFHGGTQTPGLKEPGCPESYDFQAPISEFGYIRPSYKYLKILHNFINDFGSELAPMAVAEPADPIRNELDSTSLRYIVRVKDNSGFVFLGNTQVRVNMTDKNVQLNIKLKDETVSFPSFVLKGQTTPVLPFNMNVNDVLVKYALAQPFAKVENNGNVQVFFQKLIGVNPEFAINVPADAKLDVKGWLQNKKGHLYHLTALAGNRLQVIKSDGKTVTFIFLDRKEAENAWRVNYKGKQALIISDADILLNENKLELLQMGAKAVKLKIYPANINLIPSAKEKKAMDYALYVTEIPRQVVPIDIQINKDNALIKVTSSFPQNVADIFLNVSYLGGSAEVLVNNKVATDNLYNGLNWLLGLKRFEGNEIRLKIKPWENYITGVAEEKMKQAKKEGQALQKIEIIPQYKYIINL